MTQAIFINHIYRHSRHLGVVRRERKAVWAYWAGFKSSLPERIHGKFVANVSSSAFPVQTNRRATAVGVGIIRIGTCSGWARVKLLSIQLIEQPVEWQNNLDHQISVYVLDLPVDCFQDDSFGQLTDLRCIFGQVLSSLLYYSTPAKQNA